MSTPFGRLLGRIADIMRGPANAAIERHVLEVARITPDETVLVIGARPGVGKHARSAGHTGQGDESVDVVLSVDDVQFWDDRGAGFTELYRVLRPGGRLIVSARERKLPVSRHELASEAAAAGFTDLQTWVWEPPGPAGPLAAQLRGRRPPTMS